MGRVNPGYWFGFEEVDDAGDPVIKEAGSHANAWNAAVVGVDGNSTVFDARRLRAVSVFGNSSGATNIAVQASQDNVNFYTFDTIVVAGAGNFGKNYEAVGARYIRLQSSAAVTLTATIAGKR